MTHQGGQTTQFALIPEWVLCNLELNATAIRVYGLLERHTDPDRKAFPSQKRLSEMSGLGLETVRRALRSLEECGAIATERRLRKDGSNTSNAYFLPRDPPRGYPLKNEGGSSPKNEGGILEREPAVTKKETPSESLAVQGLFELPKLSLIEGKNLGYDALQEVCKIHARSPRLKEIPVALNGTRNSKTPGIRQQFWDEVNDALMGTGFTCEEFERALAAAIRTRASVYQRVMPEAALTPTALVKWWTDLPGMLRERDNGSLHSRLSREVERLKEEGR